jgi:hypothetical protein
MAPNQVNDDNKHLVQIRLFNRATLDNKYQPKVGDKVRVELKDTALKKGYKPKFSDAVHTILSKEKHYYTVDHSTKQYQRTNLMPVNEVEVNPNEPDFEGSLEQRAKDLHKHRGNVKYNIPELNATERKMNLRTRKPTHQLLDDKYGVVRFN